MMKPILLTEAGNPDNQDRGLVINDETRAVVCVSDGAGGRTGGTQAAIRAIELVRANSITLSTAESCAALLRHMDDFIDKDPNAGETTCVLAVLTSKEIIGASVGDSGAWLIPAQGAHVDLTRGQQRKPFIGSGNAWPVPFRQPIASGCVLLATDGLLKYTTPERIIETCRRLPAEAAAQQLIELVRYQSGAIPDDVTVILTAATSGE